MKILKTLAIAGAVVVGTPIQFYAQWAVAYPIAYVAGHALVTASYIVFDTTPPWYVE